MSNFKLLPPITPLSVNQKWGVYNPGVYSQFGYTRHNGVDYALGINKEIRAPFSGTIVKAATKENGEWQPSGGGIFISLLSDEVFDFPEFTSLTPDGKEIRFGAGKYNVHLDFLHCDHLIRGFPDHVNAGDLLAIADNTGFSTGPHTHVQARRCTIFPGGQFVVGGKNVHVEWADENDANDSFDPTPFYVVPDPTPQDIQNEINGIAKIVNILKVLVPKVVALLQKR